MAQDTRRVQTAVLGSPHSDHPLSLPTDRKAAVHYLSRYKGKRYFCGVHLGGCGWELMDKLYGDRVCHFAHHPDPKGLAPACERRYSGPDSADHLYIHRGLTTGLGRVGGAQRFQGTLIKGQCTDLLVNPGKNRSAVKVQFVSLPADVWTKEDEELRARLGRVDWMLGPNALANAKHLLDRDGYVLRVRCEQQGNARVVKIGTETHDGDLEWSELKDCDISERGITTPLLRKFRPPAPRRTASFAKLPGFPLDVEDIVIYPQEVATRPIAGLGIPEGSHVAATDIQIADGERVHARLMVPDRINLLVDAPYALIKPASVNAMKGPTHATPVWTIFSSGLRPIWPSEQPSVSLPGKSNPKSALATSTEEPRIHPKKSLRTSGQPLGLVRHKLTSLIQNMRNARREGNYQGLLQTLASNDELLTTLTRTAFRQEKQAVEELRRWATAREETRQRTEREVREQSAALIRQIDQARGRGDLEEAQGAVEALRKSLVRVSPQNRGFAEEAQSLREYESWLEQARSERDRAARIRSQEVQAERLRVKQHDRLRNVLDQLLEAELAGKVGEVRRLYNEGRSLLRKLGVHATAYEIRQLNLTAQWLAAAVPSNLKGDTEISGATSDQSASSGSPELEHRTTVTPRRTAPDHTPNNLRHLTTEIGDRVATVLRRVARDQTTISLQDLAKEAETDNWLCIIALVEVDETTSSAEPLLSALMTAPDGDASPEFRAILAGLGYEVPQTDHALHLVWKREVERTHAHYAEPSREMPARLVPRRAEPAS
ncbi:hypothetical protein [Microbispora triticiradicis]|uniref:Uncharacterized protein n=2 Tax=Microbispora TaxID=2005 RepID=A0ABY3LZ37_9ACTN|nr:MULTISPECIES: hypothetical protein [Microbispora]TLP63894.1 hypothetical protein FED44_06585 [Microbispora fusca]TYB60735.1 hypothetical protein FXF59_12655 [Microbispora tritici]